MKLQDAKPFFERCVAGTFILAVRIGGRWGATASSTAATAAAASSSGLTATTVSRDCSIGARGIPTSIRPFLFRHVSSRRLNSLTILTEKNPEGSWNVDFVLLSSGLKPGHCSLSSARLKKYRAVLKERNPGPKSRGTSPLRVGK
jgi:hypothetical protein